MIKSKTYCVMPHIGLSIQNHGDICVCNQNDRSLKDDKQEVIFIHKDRLRDSWQSPTRQEIISALDNGIEFESCNGCFSQEKAGLISQRQELLSTFKDVIPSTTQPKVLIIKPGNVCNLACRMCNPATSSSWYNDAYKLDVKYNGVTESFAKWTKNFEHVRNGFNPDNVKFWDDLETWLPGLEFLDIYGGEPFLSTALFNTLGKVADRGLAGNTDLRLHTNMTIYNERYLDILSQYKSVTIGASIDSHDPIQLNYIRYPADAKQILTNLEKFQTHFITHKNNVVIEIATCITTINIYDSGEIYTELSKYGVPVALGNVYWPKEYDVRILPKQIKLQIIKNLLKTNSNEIPNWTEYLLQEVDNADTHFKKFWQVTKDLDNFRNQKFEIAFPKYYEILKSYIK